MAGIPFFLRPLPLGAITCGNERPERPASHLSEHAHVGMIWQSSGTGNLWVRGNFGSARAVNFCSLIRANATPATTIRLRLGSSSAAVDGTAGYDSGALPFIDPAITREDGLYSSHLKLPATQTYQWWRIDIGGFSGGDFRAAHLVLGQSTALSRYYSAGFETGVEDLGELSLSRWGVPDENAGLILRSLRFKLGWLTDAEYEQQIRPMMEALGKRRVLLCCFDPDAGPYRQARTYMGWLRDNPYAVGGDLMPGTHSHEFSIQSMI